MVKSTELNWLADTLLLYTPHDNKGFMKELKTEIEIEATSEKVWSILTDFEKYPEWNPFIKRASGNVKEGEKLEVFIEPPNGKGMVFNPTVKHVEEYKEFRWLGRLLFSGVFDGEHIFEISTTQNGNVIFIQREIFSGVLVPLMWGSLNKNTREGFSAMNFALKRRAESIS